MFRSYDLHQAADSGVLSQAVCLTAIAVSCLPPDDNGMIETCCGNNIGRGEEELLR
jgi:hypothetical protein